MSDLDDNLTSILSSLIDTDGIEAPNTVELPDNGPFSDGRLDFDHFASCITGNDASLHQSEDENVTSLLESHLSELSHTENSTIVETDAEHLDDVTPFDLDKPIESLLESNSTEFISQDCSDSPIPAIENAINPQNASDSLSEIQTEIPNIPEIVHSILNTVSSNELEHVSDTFESVSPDVEQNSLPSRCNQNNDAPLNEREETEINETIHEEISASNAPNGNGTVEPGADRDDLEDVIDEDEPGEMIIADTILDETVNVTATNNHSKKRRRILVCDDSNSGDSELEAEREKLLQSKSPTPSHQSAEANNNGDQNELSDDEYVYQSDPEKINSFEDDDDYIRDPNEKPGPKSKKQSTHLNNALKAKALLESAVMIPARKKKNRIIDSDDEYSELALNQPTTSVDDIGLITEDNNDMPFNVTIETEPQNSFVAIKSEFEVETKPIVSNIRVKREPSATRLEKRYPKPSFVKVEPLSRVTTQVKMEKYHANNNRRSSRKKEPKDTFGMSLNA